MTMRRKTIILLNLFLAVSLFCAVPTVFGEEYGALKGVKSAKALFDFRVGNPKSAAMQMDLIHNTYKDLKAMKKKPHFAVLFIGPSVKLVSKKREGFAPEDQKNLDAIAKTISAMSKDGIELEICLVAAKAFKVDPASVLPEIKKVPNGWISEIGYQAKGYSLVPAF
jgi:intracellular sulfur oxidation DsrE/DsrF family protein